MTDDARHRVRRLAHRAGNGDVVSTGSLLSQSLFLTRPLPRRACARPHTPSPVKSDLTPDKRGISRPEPILRYRKIVWFIVENAKEC